MIKQKLSEKQAVNLALKYDSSILRLHYPKAFDDISRLATHICRTSIARVWLIDGTQHWFNSQQSDYLLELPDSETYYNDLLLEYDLFLLQDTHQDVGFADKQIVTYSGNIWFYAGVPIVTPKGDRIGVLGVIDLLPCQLNPEQKEALLALGRQLGIQVELQNNLTQLNRALQDGQQAQEDLDYFFTLSLNMLCVAGFDGYFQRLNPAFEKTLGYTTEELLARPCIEFVHPEDREATLLQVQKLTTGTETIYEFENRYRCQDGSYKWLLWKATPITKQQLIYAAASDITERKRHQEALRQAIADNLQLAGAVASVSDGVVIADPHQANSPIIYSNPAFSRITGYQPEEIMGRNCRFLQGKDTDIEAIAQIRTAIAQQQEVKVTLLNYRKDGQPFWNELKISPVFSELGDLLYFVGIQTDVTERKQTEDALLTLSKRFRWLKEAIPQQVWTAKADGKLDYVNQPVLDYFGRTFEQMVGLGWQQVVHPDDLSICLDIWKKSLETGEPYEIEFRLKSGVDGNYRWHIGRALPIRDEQNQIVSWFGINTDIDDRKRAECAVIAHAQQQAVVAELGQQALAGTDLNILMDTAATLVAQALKVEYCQVLELILGGSAFRSHAAFCSQEEPVGTDVGAHEGSQAGFTVKPVNVEDLQGETRLSGTPLLHNHRLVSGASVIIERQAKSNREESHLLPPPFGVLGVHTSKKRQFTEDDINFLQSVANVLASAIERKRAEEALKESEERYALAVSGSNAGLWDWNLKTDQVYFSPRWKVMLGHEDREISGSLDEWFNRVHPEDLERVKSALNAHLEGLISHFEKEYRILHRDGTYRWMLCRALAVRDASGKAYRMSGSQTDITDRKLAEEQLIYDAFHDALTNLPNRALFMDRLGQAIRRCTTRSRNLYQRGHCNYQFAVLFLDLDRFKVVNDSLGHSAGDQLLIAIARRLELEVNFGDTVARIGGDEFVILLQDVKDINEVTSVANRIQKQLERPIALGGHEVFITASIGIAVGWGNPPGYTYNWPGDLLRDADIAMYRAKALGKARYEVFNTTMHTTALARLQLENDLRRALERQEFCVHYQPIVCLSTGRITGFEALVRLFHPERGMISPAEFIPLASEIGLIIPIGAWVLREACRQMHIWHREFPELTISVNLSAIEFSQPNLLTQIQQILQDTGLEARRLKLEITESAVMENAEATTIMFQQLKALGIQLSIDDFGTGYSSLSYLHRFPLNTLKIDRSFVSHMSIDGENSEIVQAIVTLAHSLHMDVIAEGVETAHQLAQLRALQCGQAQGYFFSKPVDSAAAGHLLAAAPQW
ncbi:MAG: EAL domain-containing protein [Aphanothece sp. CMT-3BRIN-NPC111]|jgi:diguanylate cyclase (GGDEF)-like protein/PAS domain S-box-containing protein|nr:EAL domain-containing protein [Aphanothece sp. CMT-3BRIN-NPC111]